MNNTCQTNNPTVRKKTHCQNITLSLIVKDSKYNITILSHGPHHTQMESFRNALDNCELRDLGFIGQRLHGAMAGLVINALWLD